MNNLRRAAEGYERMENMEKIAISVPEAAEMLGMCPKSVYQLTRRADFPAFKTGNRTIISVEGLRAWVLKHATGEGAAV